MVCLVCKTPWPRPRVPCDFCLEGLLELREPFTRKEPGYAVRSLFAWRAESPPALGWLVRSLKKQADGVPWLELAAGMVDRFGPVVAPIFVPIPSLGPNHAVGLSRALAHWTGGPVVRALGVALKRGQKYRSRADRQDVVLDRLDWTYCTKFTNVIIVDDIVTTGATTRAAYHALGRPKNCEVWCLMDRRPCGQ